MKSGAVARVLKLEEKKPNFYPILGLSINMKDGRATACGLRVATCILLFFEARCGDMKSSLLRRDLQSSLVSFEIGWYIFSSVIRPSIYVSSSLALIVVG
jgi:hypothetical protein